MVKIRAGRNNTEIIVVIPERRIQSSDQNRVFEFALHGPACQDLRKLRLFGSVGRKFQLDQDCLASSVDFEWCDQSSVGCPDPGWRVCNLDKSHALGFQRVNHIGGGNVASLSHTMEPCDQCGAFEVL